MAEWYYVGLYGQLGPLTREQIDELIEGGVIQNDTYVWRTGMAQWQLAEHVDELRAALHRANAFAAPAAPPPFAAPAAIQAPGAMYTPANFGAPAPAPMFTSTSLAYRDYTAIRSDRSRVLAGILQVLLPGSGRIYLGYFAYGVIQLVLAFCSFGIIWIWSIIDGIIILSGGLKLDGFGRALGD